MVKNKLKFMKSKNIFIQHFSKAKRSLFILIILLVFIVMLFNMSKPLPKDISYYGKMFNVSENDIEFLYDLTYDENNSRVYSQQIFDRVFEMIDGAEEYILIDMFLFNDFKGKNAFIYRNLSSELAISLIEKKEQNPDIVIDYITDEINIVYGGARNNIIEDLQNSGVNVVFTYISSLRDSNPIYSAIYRVFFSWMGVGNNGVMSHPFSDEQPGVSIRAYLKMLNFKANHRKLIVADDGNGKFVSLVTSANPHDASSGHSNIAVYMKGEIAYDIINSEIAVAKLGNSQLGYSSMLNNDVIHDDNIIINNNEHVKVQFITEGKIRERVLNEIKNTSNGDEINLAMFYISDRGVINALLDSSKRGVKVKLILDPNKDAFGYEKNGIPNRQVASELMKRSGGKIEIRWYDTKGEQFHTKLLVINKKKHTIIITGSANYTKRNLKDLKVKGSGGSTAKLPPLFFLCFSR